jgi:hypothetical protein
MELNESEVEIFTVSMRLLTQWKQFKSSEEGEFGTTERFDRFEQFLVERDWIRAAQLDHALEYAELHHRELDAALIELDILDGGQLNWARREWSRYRRASGAWFIEESDFALHPTSRARVFPW